MSVNKSKPKPSHKTHTHTHTHTARDLDDRWFISDRGENAGPDPCPKRSAVNTLTLREAYTD